MAVRQIRPMRRHTGRSTFFESAVNTDFQDTSRSIMRRSVRIKDGRGIDALITEEKTLWRKIKTDSAELHLKTKVCFETQTRHHCLD